MADTAEQKPKKRRVRDPQTFRERAIKAAEEGSKPPKRHRIRKGVGKVANPVLGPTGRTLAKVFNRQPFIFIGKILKAIGRVILPGYVRNSWKELQQVTWPNWQQSRQLTFAVLLFAIVFGAIIALVDFGLDKLFRNVLLK